jgi:hypothetical protein
MTLPTAANQDKCDYCDKGDIELTKNDVSPDCYNPNSIKFYYLCFDCKQKLGR